jgi:hypothetical protein
MSTQAEPEPSVPSSEGWPCPAMPVVEPGKLTLRFLYFYLDAAEVRHNLGWQRLRGDAGTSFVLLRNALMAPKVLERFPLTEKGWARAWQGLVKIDPASANAILEKEAYQLASADKSADLRRLNAGSLARLPVTYLGGYGVGDDLQPRMSYELRFLQESVGVYMAGRWTPLAQVPYAEVEAVDIGGPGLVRSGGGFVGGGFGAAGAVEGMAVAAVLNAVTTKVRVKTVIRIQAVSCEMFMLHTDLTPDALRIRLSEPLGLIRASQSARFPDAVGPAGGSAAVVEQLGRLAQMLEAGLLTRDEFDRLKSELLAGS